MNEFEPAYGTVKNQGVYFGWVVVMGVFFMVAVTCGSFYSFGVFFMPIMEEFGWSRSAVSGILFVSGIAYASSVPLIGSLADRFGYKWVSIITAFLMGLGLVLGSRAQTIWQMYLFFGLLQGVGACAAIPLPISMITNWFIRRQGLALGIASAGIGTGAATVPLLMAFAETQFGWRIAMLLLGVLILLIYIPIALFVIRRPNISYVAAYEGKPPVVKDQATVSANQDISLFEAIKTRPFWSLFTIFGFCVLCVGLIMTHLVPYARDTGISSISAASLLTIMGLSSIVGRLNAGFISDRIGAIPVLLCGLFVQGGMILSLSQMSSLEMFYIFAALFGIAYGGNLVMIPRLTAATFGVKSMGAIYGGLSAADGIGFALGPLLAGYLFDLSGNYNDAFLLTAAGIFIAIGMTYFLKQRR